MISYTYIFDGEVNMDNLSNLLIFLNSTKGEKKKIFFSSEGGSTDIGDIMIDILNQDKDDIELIAFSVLSSCAIDVFYQTNCDKSIKDGCYGLYHGATYTIDMSERGKLSHKEEKWAFDHSRRFSILNTNKMCYKLGLSKHEESQIKEGEDVLFSTERLREFIKNYQEK